MRRVPDEFSRCLNATYLGVVVVSGQRQAPPACKDVVVGGNGYEVCGVKWRTITNASAAE